MRNIPHTNPIQFRPMPFAKNNQDIALGLASDTIEQDIRTVTAKNRILIVEDNLINQKVAKLFIEKFGYEADIASNGKEALAMFNHGYSLILMDLGLPDLDGIEITKKIREQNKHIPIIACTASGESYRRKCLDAGMDGFIVKPLMIEELKQILDKFLVVKKTH